MWSGRIVGTVAVLLLMGATACAGGSKPAPEKPAAAPDVHAGHTPTSAPPPAPLREGERFVELSMKQPYLPTPPNGGTDEYRCFLVDPGLAEPAFVTGSEFLPQNAQVVHHAIFFRVDPGDVAEARQLDADAPGDGWTCFGGTGIGARRDPAAQLRAGGAWIAAWAPGAKETLLDPRIGYRMEPGSLVIMQIHYNLLATDGKAAGTDQSGIRLRMKPGTADLQPLQTILLPAPVELPCAAGESGPLCDRERSVLDVWRRFGDEAGATVARLNLLCNGGRRPVAGQTQKCDQKIRAAGTLYAVAGHMHLLGRSIKVELNPDTPQAQTLLDVPIYNFDDQGAHPLPSPVAVKVGDVLRVTCTHDATLRRQLPALQKLPPRYVVWGEGTSDEMCLGIAVWSRPGA
jgi:hypothetical protein